MFKTHCQRENYHLFGDVRWEYLVRMDNFCLGQHTHTINAVRVWKCISHSVECFSCVFLTPQKLFIIRYIRFQSIAIFFFFLRSIGGMMGNTVVFTHRLSLSGGQLARLRECFRFSLFRYETAFESSNPVWECYTAYMKIWKQLLSIREYKPINCSRRV